MASMLPTASPSGREWEQTRNRSPWPQHFENCFDWHWQGPPAIVEMVLGGGGVVHRRATHRSLLRLRDRPISSSNARLETTRPIGEESQFRNVAHTHPLLQFVADVSLGGFKAGDGLLLGLGDVGDGVVESHVDPCRFTA